ncbi:uncharacterized protein BX664DRAFT_257633 [Halteromyces radiatus]|uniref:uncharacterized protein n=1 Tax=Halteromyces radiatus TaxID=101107 RepID=UPI002220F1B4|nr:uncharacterized protein BX664DRAFT_257633 [Halteromyces radiatus]KAI8097563.1 hypothetical protein BX664DRAFT_257633 [Halteromyces radiatus]
MVKFQPNTDHKNVKLYDTTQKKHITFEDQDNASPKKRSQPDQPLISSSNKRSKSIIDLPSTKGITTPSRTKPKKSSKTRAYLDQVNRPMKQKVAKTEQDRQAQLQARGLAKRDAKRQKMKERRRTKKLAKVIDGVQVQVPVFHFTPDKIRHPLKVVDLRNFILYCLTTGPVPKFAHITRSSCVQRMVVIHSMGLDITSFGAPLSRVNVPHTIPLASVDPKTAIGKANMPFLVSHMSHMLVYKLSSSFSGVVLNPLSELLQCPVSWSQREKNYAEMKEKLEQSDVDRNELHMLSLKELQDGGYPIPPFLDPTSTLPDGWKETKPAIQPIEKKRLIAVDCEMVLTASGSSLARVSLLDENGQVLLDEYVLPDEPILDYLTEFSGITKKIMDETTCSLRRAQKHFRKLVDHNVILIGHSLDSDLKALQVAHPYCADTALLYDSKRGPPFRPALRSLAKHYLKRNIQENDLNRTGLGHNSAEDARATMDLFKLKVQRGFSFGRISKNIELVFNRLAQSTPPMQGMILETNNTGTQTFQSSLGSKYKKFASDETLVDSLVEGMNNDQNFILAQFEPIKHLDEDELEDQPPTVISNTSTNDPILARKLAKFDDNLKKCYEAIPENTVVVVMGGIGDVPTYRR